MIGRQTTDTDSCIKAVYASDKNQNMLTIIAWHHDSGKRVLRVNCLPDVNQSGCVENSGNITVNNGFQFHKLYDVNFILVL